MIEITFKDSYDYKYRNDVFYELHVMKNGLDQVLYVGISTQNIWNRWFAWNGHILGGPRHFVGESSVGQKVVDHLPDSWNWKIQLWTLDDCVSFCDAELNPNGRYTIQMVEPFMIAKLRPTMNVMYNSNPAKDLMSKSQREIDRERLLDEVYREVFERKQKR